MAPSPARCLVVDDRVDADEAVPAHTEEVGVAAAAVARAASLGRPPHAAIVDLNSGESHREPPVGTRGVAAIAFERAASLLLSAAADRTVLVWNPFLDERLCVLKGHQHPLVSVAVAAGRIISADLSAAFGSGTLPRSMPLLRLPTDALLQGVTQATLLAAVAPTRAASSPPRAGYTSSRR